MNSKFDELTKTMAQSVTRRGALKKFGLGLAGMALACLVGFTDKAAAAKPNPCGRRGAPCQRSTDCCNFYCSNGYCSCKATGMSCSLGSQCCSGRCVGSVFQGLAVCA
jgi:hypothetical protein